MHSSNRWAVLAVVCASVYLINLDITIVNATLPTLVRELHAGTRDLQWVVDGYNLTFAAFVLAAGSLSDRYGRRAALVTGLAIFGTASAAGATAGTTGGLIAARLVMGVGAAVIFPTTLSIISNTFTDRRERAQAIGIWGAITGLGVASGPLAGGWLLEHFWWGSVFLYMAPVAALAIALAWRFVPESRDPATPPIDRLGLVLSTAAVGTLVYTIIEAPDRSWGDPLTLAGFALSAALLVAFVGWERRQTAPMIDVRLFRDLRFSAACGAVTVAWFCLFGFIFLITQYFQFLKGYAPLKFGAALMPVAGAIAVGAVTGVLLSVRVGNKAVVATGLGLMGIFFLWVSTLSASTPYWPEIVGQMIVMGLGLGLTTAPATEAIMGVVPPDKAGIGSAVNDATRELGGTLGVAIIGSVSASIYTRALGSATLTGLPAQANDAARKSVGGALLAAGALGRQAPELSGHLIQAADAAFFRSLHAACLIACFVALAGGAFAAAMLPSRPSPGRAAVPTPGEATLEERPAPAA